MPLFLVIIFFICILLCLVGLALRPLVCQRLCIQTGQIRRPVHQLGLLLTCISPETFLRDIYRTDGFGGNTPSFIDLPRASLSSISTAAAFTSMLAQRSCFLRVPKIRAVFNMIIEKSFSFINIIFQLSCA